MTLLLLLAAAYAEPFGLVPVQGQLSDVEGVAIDQSLPVTFSLYATEDAGSALWHETQVVDFAGGTFTAYLGDVEPLDLAVFGANRSSWLGIAVDGDGEMNRFPLAFAPYAAVSASLDGLTKDDFLPADWEIDPEAVEDLALGVCYDTPEELVAALDGQYRPADWVPTWEDIDLPTDLQGLSQATVQDWARDVSYDTRPELTAALAGEYRAADWVPAWSDIDLPADLQGLSQATVQDWARDVSYDTTLELTTALEGEYREGTWVPAWSELDVPPEISGGEASTVGGLTVDELYAEFERRQCEREWRGTWDETIDRCRPGFIWLTEAVYTHAELEAACPNNTYNGGVCGDTGHLCGGAQAHSLWMLAAQLGGRFILEVDQAGASTSMAWTGGGHQGCHTGHYNQKFFYNDPDTCPAGQSASMHVGGLRDSHQEHHFEGPTCASNTSRLPALCCLDAEELTR